MAKKSNVHLAVTAPFTAVIFYCTLYDLDIFLKEPIMFLMPLGFVVGAVWVYVFKDYSKIQQPVLKRAAFLSSLNLNRAPLFVFGTNIAFLVLATIAGLFLNKGQLMSFNEIFVHSANRALSICFVGALMSMFLLTMAVTQPKLKPSVTPKRLAFSYVLVFALVLGFSFKSLKADTNSEVSASKAPPVQASHK